MSPTEAVLLDDEALLTLTNPGLKETLKFSELRANSRLSKAFELLEQLTPGSLRTSLRDTLKQWAHLDGSSQDRFLAEVHHCSEALRFARLMASRYTTGTAGCLAGTLGCIGVWSGCVLVFGTRLRLWGWIGVAMAGLLVGGLLGNLLWHNRDREWVKDVLVPEADRSGISLGMLLAILEGSGSLKRGQDELGSLRELPPTIRAVRSSSGMTGDETMFRFASPKEVVSCPVRAKEGSADR